MAVMSEIRDKKFIYSLAFRHFCSSVNAVTRKKRAKLQIKKKQNERSKDNEIHK